MGGSFSAFNKFGLPGLSTATTKQVYERHFKTKATGKFEDFHIAYVDFCKYFNTIMPGQDFDTPTLEEIKEFYYKTWVPAPEDERKELFFYFMKEKVHEAKVDDRFFIAAGIAAPAAAVIGKRASGQIPYVKSLRLDMVPNVVFVPAVTLFGIIGATMWRMSSRSAAAKEEVKKDEKRAAEQRKEEVKQDEKPKTP
ncbi:hypothetical protein GQ55_1G021700 [Panicum hallii var. hallii]|uniref:Uncharacterized protein n=1 Tax=Panicum hallii var. hallii TaxID=1504633 RepID=A0A2T7F1B5_9POAL|nr:hypothetical protein GQ55_1G021700 [Panicum hallii var. hallii]